MCPYSDPVASPGRSHWPLRRQRRPLDSLGRVFGPPGRPQVPSFVVLGSLGRPLADHGLRMCVFA
jgi:hypothetical protein